MARAPATLQAEGGYDLMAREGKTPGGAKSPRPNKAQKTLAPGNASSQINVGKASLPSHDNRGKFAKGNHLGAGRPPGSKDKRPRAGTLRAVYEDLSSTARATP
jgi:hypothetical protein